VNERQMLVDWLDHEQWATEIMLGWFSHLPSASRTHPDYQRALDLVGHVVACRENWLDRIAKNGGDQVEWWPKGCEAESLFARAAATLAAWKSFVSEATDEVLLGDFEYTSGDQTWRFNVQCQAMQMVGHGFYHRGQVASLITALGGTTSDTDHLFWKMFQTPERWGKVLPKSDNP
jgi:uncharacterized damage-inducible protein DinB